MDVRLLGLVISPFTLAIQLVTGIYFGVICAYLVPRPLVLPRPIAEAARSLPWLPTSLSKSEGAALGFCVGMLALAYAIKHVAMREGRTRVSCRWRPVLS